MAIVFDCPKTNLRRWFIFNLLSGTRAVPVRDAFCDLTSRYGFGVCACVPITSPETIMSTRRFSLRPAAVLLSATGFDLPNPWELTWSGGTLEEIRYARTPSARC